MSLGKIISLYSLKQRYSLKQQPQASFSAITVLLNILLVIKQMSTIFEHILHCPLVINKGMDAILVKYTNYQSWYYHAAY